MQKIFTIKSKPDLKFRNKELSPLKVLALQTQIDFSNMGKVEELFSFILENTEVSVNGYDWIPVKEKGREIYYPSGIEKNLNNLNEIVLAFLNEIIKPLFTESNK